MRLSRLIPMTFLAVAAVVSISCSADRASGPSTVLTVAKCAPAVPAFASKTIGSGGGTLAIGNNKLVVPAGALTSSVSMSMEILADSSSSVLFQPQGLTFAAGKPAKLTLTYDQCTSPSAASQAVRRLDHDDKGPPTTTTRVAYTTDNLVILEVLLSNDDPQAEEVSASVKHFSRYAVAW